MEKIGLFVLEFILLSLALFLWFLSTKYPNTSVGVVICVFLAWLLILLQMIKVI